MFGKKKVKDKPEKLSLKELAGERGTYTSSLICRVCHTEVAVETPKRCKPSEMSFSTALGWCRTDRWRFMDEATGETYLFPECQNCRCTELKPKEKE